VKQPKAETKKPARASAMLFFSLLVKKRTVDTVAGAKRSSEIDFI
jgi:hypothetical protein